MSSLPSHATPDAVRPGVFNYLDQAAEPSLYRNGKVLAQRDEDGSDGGMVGVDLEPHTLDVHDARTLDDAARMTCEANGFELLDAPLDDDTLDFLDHEQVVRNYYRECERLVAGHTGARAFAFDHNIRSALGKQSKRRIAGGQQVQGPAKIVHGDYTLVSAPQRLRDLSRPPNTNDTLRTVLRPGEALLTGDMVEAALAPGGRYAIINVWRSIAEEPVQTNPLALCDGRTVAPEDLVVFEIHYRDRIGENYFAKYSPRHAFHFFPEMTREEPMLIKQWDSAGTLARSEGARGDDSVADAPCTFSFHSAFDDLSVPDDAPDRLSIEVRCIVIYA